MPSRCCFCFSFDQCHLAKSYCLAYDFVLIGPSVRGYGFGRGSTAKSMVMILIQAMHGDRMSRP